jgi:hypothetical protein
MKKYPKCRYERKNVRGKGLGVRGNIIGIKVKHLALPVLNEGFGGIERVLRRPLTIKG